MSALYDIQKQRNSCEKEIERVKLKIESRLEEIEQLKGLLRKEEVKLDQYDAILKHCEGIFDEV